MADVLVEEMKEIPVTVGRSWREPRLLQKILESKKYLARKRLEARVLSIFVIIVGEVKVLHVMGCLNTNNFIFLFFYFSNFILIFFSLFFSFSFG